MSLSEPICKFASVPFSARGLAWGVVTILALMLGVLPEPASARVFTQEALRYSNESTPVEPDVIEPDSLAGLQTWIHDLDGGRVLEVRTNLATDRRAEVAELAAVVRRCYSYLEAVTGRNLEGGVMLYLVQFPQRPRTYRFQVTVSDDAGWNEVRLAMLDAGQPVLGRGASSHVTEFIYDTLPHELAHSLLTTPPTVRHDLDGQPPLGTRWFIEGVCEFLAKGFAAVEAPGFWQSALARRHVGDLSNRPDLGSRVWDWGQGDDADWSVESALYGLSMLLVRAWTDHIELPDLLEELARRGGELDGDGLLRVLRDTTGLERHELVARAWELDRSLRPVAVTVERIQ